MTAIDKTRESLTRVRDFSRAWAIIILLVAADAVWLEIARLSIPRNSLLVAASAVGGMLMLTAVYSYLRPDERLAGLTENTAKVFAYSISLAVFGYLVVTLRLPMIDRWLAAADRAVGFDWPAVYAWVQGHAAIRYILIAAYDSVVPQIGILMALLVTLKHYDRVHSLLWLYIASSITYVLISAVLPAAGAFGYYKTALNTPYLQQFYALRSGNMKMLDLLKLQGVVQFPYIHLALADLCTYVTRGMRFLFPVFSALNLLVIAATPAIGGHFFADLWVSALLMGGLIFTVERRLEAARPPAA